MTRPGMAIDPSPIDTAGIIEFAANQVRRLVDTHPDAIPVHTRDGRWLIADDAWAPSWTGGFLAGQMWVLAGLHPDGSWRERAEHYSRLVEGRRHDRGTHDIGFLFTPSWGRWHRAAPSERTATVLVDAARSLASNFNENGRYIRTWVDPGSTFIDIMMNVDLLFEAAAIADDPSLSGVAYEHARTSRRHLVRGDATTAHEGWFDPLTGEFQRHATHQGYRSDSSWVRGHAWALYGFTSCYIRTGDADFLDTARALADTYLRHADGDPVPPNDWEDPVPEHPYEASAGSILSSALLQLAEVDVERRDRYESAGLRLLGRLGSPPFLAVDDPAWEGLIRLATYHRANGLGVQESNMWGDYYFLEAVERAAALGRAATAEAR
ncbi:unsaturated chondroitin disaccharide hydrolase [Salana multivorans]|uniref:Unsaturated chondroitin disaccharide hydrolase n=1 Tax=Salana multivorans TaxID=120377 RepID=A0A3N2D9B1_9MICO|nr:glycoside hydrolase family 88 protein [Salana multivorans]ROR96370.1 unsaturated chondroitin disaccharide hydrolase [Salana multivorans]